MLEGREGVVTACFVSMTPVVACEYEGDFDTAPSPSNLTVVFVITSDSSAFDFNKILRETSFVVLVIKI